MPVERRFREHGSLVGHAASVEDRGDGLLDVLDPAFTAAQLFQDGSLVVPLEYILAVPRRRSTASAVA